MTRLNKMDEARLDELGRAIASEQDGLLARASTRAEVRARLDVLELPHVARRVAPLALWSAAAACALGGAFALSLLWNKPGEPTVLAVEIGEDSRPGVAGTWVEASSESAVAMRFSDGTRVDVAPNSRARIAELSHSGAHLLLENGLARVHVKRLPNANWRISAGPFAVKVTGTQFDVRWNPERDAFQLDLREGHVEISGCVFGERYALNAGQRAIASCRRGRLNVTSGSELADKAQAPQPVVAPAIVPPAGTTAAATGVDSEASTDAASARRSSRSRAPAARGGSASEAGKRTAPRWRVWAEAGRYADALAAVRDAGFLSECHRANAAELLLLSDLARYGREYQDAGYALRQLRQRFPGSRQAARAAFALGKLDSDHDDSYAEAAGWFRTYLRELPAGSLAREASGRLLEATARAGDSAGARELAAQYLRDYPAGPHAALATSLRGDAR